MPSIPAPRLLIGARHLHLPVVSILPILHGFLVLADEHGHATTYSGDRGRGALLVVYAERYTARHPDARGLVVLRVAYPTVDADLVRASFHSTRARIQALGLTYNWTARNCNAVITTLLLQAGLELPPPPARFLPGYGQPLW